MDVHPSGRRTHATWPRMSVSREYMRWWRFHSRTRTLKQPSFLGQHVHGFVQGGQTDVQSFHWTFPCPWLVASPRSLAAAQPRATFGLHARRRAQGVVESAPFHVAVGQNQWCRFGIGAPPILEPILVGIGMFTRGTGL